MIHAYFVPLPPLSPEEEERVQNTEITQADRMAAEGLTIAINLAGDLFVAFANPADALAFAHHMAATGPLEGVIFRHGEDLTLSGNTLERATREGLDPLFFIRPEYVGFIIPHRDALDLLARLSWP
ncbi:MAG: hypothetical protein KM310_06900 [Clostridiales bacterium]|nr:hypothetical protein [Clostridiales bacterium]